MGEGGKELEKFLAEKVFAEMKGTRIEPVQKDVMSFNKFMERYTAGLKIEKAAVENLKRS